jgi:hypothetical protein
VFAAALTDFAPHAVLLPPEKVAFQGGCVHIPAAVDFSAVKEAALDVHQYVHRSALHAIGGLV